MTKVVCGACGGKGHRAGYTDHGGAMRAVLEDCECCNGSGEVCATCKGKGYQHRLPEGFNPFRAGGWNTINAMYRVPCRDCQKDKG